MDYMLEPPEARVPDDYRPFWHCVECGREYDDVDNGICPSDDCPSRTGDYDGPLEPDKLSDEDADRAEDRWIAERDSFYK